MTDSITRGDSAGDVAFGLDGQEAAVGALGALALAATVLGFFLNQGWTAIPFFAFVAVVSYGWIVRQPFTARAVTLLTTVVAVAILVLITAFLFQESLPAFLEGGIGMFTTTEPPFWQFSGENPTIVLTPMIVGTIITTFIAMSIAGPLGVAGALFISEIAPGPVREVVKPGVEMMAGIPSIVYGFIGFVILNSYMSAEFALTTNGSYIVVGLVVGVMALPTVVSIAEDALNSVPDAIRDGSLAMGATNWQTMKAVTVPAGFSGISAAVLLGVGRAIGETMAATVILGHQKVLPDPLYDVFGNGETLTSVIAFEYGNASGIHMEALFAAGVVLFVTVLVLSIGSQYVERRMQQKLGGNR